MPKPSLQDEVARVSGQAVIRWFFYVGFMICSTATVATLGLGGSWWAPMAGTFVFGLPTVIAYLAEQGHQHNMEAVRATQRQSGGRGGWDLDDDDDGDPTVPPPPRERTR